MSRQVARAAFPAMSVLVEIVGVNVDEERAAEAAEAAGALAAEWERRFSRFLPDSQLVRLNDADGAPTPVDAAFLALLRRAVAGVRRTGGRFDPSVLPALEAAGYRRSWPAPADGPGPTTAPPPALGPAAWDRIVVDHLASTVALPTGMRLDLGGIAKGAFADLVAARLRHWPGGSVSVGGDLVVWGSPPDGDAWEVGIEDPQRPGDDLLVAHVPAGRSVGIATSGMHRRRWGADGHEAHHLIDPATGRPLADTGVVAATAIAASATDAEIATKAILVAAAAGDAPDLADAEQAVLVHRDGRVVVTRGKEIPNATEPVRPHRASA